MPIQPDRHITRHFNGVLNNAAIIINAAHAAFQNGELTEELIDATAASQADLIRTLAQFEDGNGYGAIDFDRLDVMRTYEFMADNLLECCKTLAAEGTLELQPTPTHQPELRQTQS